MSRSQRGTTTVEFAVVGGVVLLVLLGCIEMSRLFFIMNTLAESTRRAARLATVCPPNDAAIVRAALLKSEDGGATSRYIAGLQPSNIQVQYMDATGATTAAIGNMRYVRVSITGYQHRVILPWVGRMLPVQSFATTMPTESLGWVPETQTHTCLAG